ncbi:MAG: type IV pilus assembly protein PilM [Candidatus Paceibacterota bacterium]|jgi:type IV pilus assembly protein PilM
MNPFRFITQKFSPSYLGIDIGTTSIKAVEVKKGNGLPQVVNYGFLESSGHLLRSNDVLQTSSLKISEDQVIANLKMVIKKMKPKTNIALASIPVFSVFMTVFDFPEMSQGDLEKSLAFQARQYIPLPISEVALDWIKVGEREDDKGFKYEQVLLISVPQELIKKYQFIFKSVGLKLKALEIENLSLARGLSSGDPTQTIIVDIGSLSTDISFVSNGQVRFNSQSDYASASLTQALATSLNISPIRAEELKKEHGIINLGPNYELSTIMLPFLDVIINEVRKAQFNYESQFPGTAKIERIILSGGGANLVGIEKYFEKDFNLPVVKAAPFSKFSYPSSIELLVGELNPLMSVALGLALREFT